MKNWKLLSVIFALLVLLLAACGTEDEATEKASTDEKATEETSGAGDSSVYPLTIPQPEGYAEVTLEEKPETVVVFDYGFLDTLDYLGVDVAAVSQANVPSYLEKYEDEAAYKNAGALKEPDFEAIAAMNPDVIFISGRQADAYEELSKIAKTVYVGVDTMDYMNSFKANTELAGKIFGEEEKATAALEELDAKIEEMKEVTNGMDEKALVVLASEGELSAYGAGSRFGIIHDVYGFKQTDENLEVSTHGQSVAYEYVLEKNPDILFVVDRDAVVAAGGESGTKAAIENDIVNKTNAAQNDNIIYLDPEVWYLAGGGIESENAKVDAVLEALK
ncbi:iron complex transport system substrate-binding protein [Psychrobacillus sp. OK028]|uniref:siderophore ABC transporter substrate-binding protein n=1 Tax=Psychrobacillus sp. OK028 TaxID=1884359 RepID=UPI00088A6C09|nr:siderophore ABC transporter substrate-binding protein [Psychrobacillus sp. OK028]SDN41754.1 iron complex transport system substrate-binding protein [Psychrobacillus sp. OK028]